VNALRIWFPPPPGLQEEESIEVEALQDFLGKLLIEIRAAARKFAPVDWVEKR
jgi:hypothetical protein